MKTNRDSYIISNGRMYTVYENYNRKQLKKDCGDVSRSRFPMIAITSIMITIALVSGLLSWRVMFNNNSDIEVSNESIQITNEIDDISDDILLSENTVYHQSSQHVEKVSSSQEQFVVQTLVDERSDIDVLNDSIGNDLIELSSSRLIKYHLPDMFYGDNLDYSSFQPFMDYRSITNTKSKGYAVCNSESAYTDEKGFRRYKLSTDELSVNGDDYIVALGTFYKPEGVIGNRYLIVTTAGAFTVRTGDEKADNHTDQFNMFTIHGDNKAGIIEFIVDSNVLDEKVVSSGTATKCEDFKELQGEILYIYEIQ